MVHCDSQVINGWHWVSIVMGGSPNSWWFTMENPKQKWMIWGLAPWLRKPPSCAGWIVVAWGYPTRMPLRYWGFRTPVSKVLSVFFNGDFYRFPGDRWPPPQYSPPSKRVNLKSEHIHYSGPVELDFLVHTTFLLMNVQLFFLELGKHAQKWAPM